MNPRPTTPVRLQWIAIAAIWLGIGVFNGLQAVVTMRFEGMQHPWTAVFFTDVLSWLPWAAATPVVAYLGRRYSPLRNTRASTWIAHLLALVGLLVAAAAWRTLLQLTFRPWAPLGMGPWTHVLLTELGYGALPATILYAAMLTICVVVDFRAALSREQLLTAQLNEQLTKARLHALQHQTEPHFLFNALNSIAGLVRERRHDDAVNMIAGLGDLLRRSIHGTEVPRVPLASELEYLERYLSIQKVRYAERLSVHVDIPQTLMPVLVPSLLLQPLVENAIKHGIARRTQGGVISISGSQGHGMLTLTVRNDGLPLAPQVDPGTRGIGLENLRRRLELLYGLSFELTLRNDIPDGVRAHVAIPLQVA